MSRELLKEAIADAKAVKEAAIANAKAALEEAFTPHLKELLASKLESLEESEEMEEMKMKYKMEEEKDEMEEMMHGKKEKGLEELDLEEILAELEGSLEEEDERMMNEAKKDDSEEESEEDEKEEKSEKKGDDELVGEMTEDELKNLIMSVFDEMGIEAGPGGEGDMGDLESDIMAGEEADMGGEEGADELEEIDLAALMEEIALEEAKKKKGKMMMKKDEKKEEKDEEKEMMKEELEEAYSTIKALRSDLNEVNLLNAKLLYTNKIFKAKNLTESQKVKVLSTFDKATTVKEVKLVFESLSTSITTATNNTAKAPIKESMGFASKASGIVKNNQTIETDAVIARMKKLAGL